MGKRAVMIGGPAAAIALLAGVAFAHGGQTGGGMLGSGGMMGQGMMGGPGYGARGAVDRDGQPAATQATPRFPVDDGAIPVVATVRLTAREWRFQPSTLTIPAGKPVRLVLRDAGRIVHDVGIDGMPATILAVQNPTAMGTMDPAETQEMAEKAADGVVHIHVAAGQIASEVFEATKPGTYRFACEIPGHKEAGMVGTVVVAP